MAVTTGTVHSVRTIRADDTNSGGLQFVEVLFTMSGTYAQSDDSKLASVATLIQNSRRNGKTVTLVDCMRGQPATIASDPTTWMGIKSAAISSADITFTITLNSHSTEHTDSTAIAAQSRPFSMIVAVTEA